MTEERMKELLNAIVEHESVARTCKETIQYLLQLGFTTEELHNHFNFSLSDINDAIEGTEE